MAFVRFQSRPPLSFTLSKSNIHIPQDVHDLLKDAKRVELLYDIDRKAIKIVADDKGLFAVLKANNTGRYWRISAALSKHMPSGIYVYKEDGIFEYWGPSMKRSSQHISVKGGETDE